MIFLIKKRKNNIFFSACIILTALSPFLIFTRSIYRSASQETPRLCIRWKGDTQCYFLVHPNLEVGPIFTNFNQAYLEQHKLPVGMIQPRNPQLPPVEGAQIVKILEKFVEELQNSYRLRSHYEDVIIIKKRDYNPRSHAGLIIVKLKKYPGFIAKIFMETPASFASPFSKGFEPSVFFIMGSINRHISGFLRIKNAEVIQELINNDPHWKGRVEIPRKWFWNPPNQQLLEITSAHLGTHEHRIVIPSVYAVIVDAIVPDQEFNIFNYKHRAKALEFCHFVGIRVDSHINNFMIEKNTGLLILIDTEHFPSMVGLRKSLAFSGYPEWYIKLSAKGIVDCFGRTKAVRKKIQSTDERLVLEC